uniref:Protein amnionless n=1 Tax=Meloidogyne javanica TaxID=6303 RepID=A0A915MK08_MELJA
MKEREIFFGSPNSNFFEPQFSALCAFVSCEPFNSYCSLPLKPVGQCCEQCGAILSFRQNTLNFTKSLEIIRKYAKLIKDFEWLPKDSGISFVRIDNDDFHPLYQVFFLN